MSGADRIELHAPTLNRTMVGCDGKQEKDSM